MQNIFNLVDDNINTNNCIEKFNYLMDEEKSLIKRNLGKNIEHYKPHLSNNILSSVLCDYIIATSEKYAKNIEDWQTSRHVNYPTTDLPTKVIPELYLLVQNIIYYKVFPLIEENYKVDKRLLCIGDSFVVKYDATKQNYLGKHKDGCLFSFSILLNDPCEFEGGGTKFFMKDNEFSINHKKGDCLIHGGHTEHSGNKIEKGFRYLLVGFIRYCNFITPNEVKNKLIYDFNCNNENNLGIKMFDVKSNFTNLITEMNENMPFLSNCMAKIKTRLLDLEQEKMSFFEKFIYEMFVFHMKRLNLFDKIDDYYCEYWIKRYEKKAIKRKKILHTMHVDKDEHLWTEKNILINPILATVSYFVCSDTPTVITNTNSVSFDDNKIINLKNGLAISMPSQIKKNTVKHVCFNGSNYHGVYNLNKCIDTISMDQNMEDENDLARLTILFNIWDKKPEKSNSLKPYNDYEVPKIKFYQKNEKLIEIKPSENIKYKSIKSIEMYNLVKDILLNERPEKSIEMIQQTLNKDKELKEADVVILTI